MAFRSKDPGSPLPWERRIEASSLDDLYDQYEQCEDWEHLRLPGINFVPGYGCRTQPRIMLVGEAPGAQENARLRPFCGPSGRVLGGLMELAGIRLDEEQPTDLAEAAGMGSLFRRPANAFITNVVKYRPPGNRTPTVGEVLSSTPWIRAEWRVLGKPRVIVAIGATARSVFCGGMPETMPWGTPVWRRAAGVRPEDRLWMVAQYHPAFGLRNPSHRPRMELHWEDMSRFLIEEGIV